MPDEITILIVDDEEINLDILEGNLVPLGYRVARARDGHEALEIARAEPPALVIADILMPNMDGYQLCRELKNDKGLGQVPLIFYSATYTDDDDRDFALSLGAARFVTKPEDPDRFAKVIKEVLAEYRGGDLTVCDHVELDENTYLSRYNQRLISKLEDKLKQLDKSNRRLGKEVERSLKAEDKVRQLAYFDSLTGLPNRANFVDRCVLVFEEAGAAGRGCALVVFDIDRFWEISHTLGHRMGSLLLRRLGERLSEAMAGQDGLFARLGGDEFVVLLDHVNDRKQAQTMARELLERLDTPFDLDGLLVEVSFSIGIALFPEHATEAAPLLRHAEVAMRGTRPAGGVVSFYTPEADPYQPERLDLISSLRRAIREGQLVLHYQPKVDLLGHRTVGAEALVRWNHPRKGLLQPDRFIGIAEQTGQMRALTSQLLRFSLSEFAAWRADGLDLELCLNLSPRNLLDEELPGELQLLLEKEGVAADRLTFEITESAILRDPARARRVLDRISAMGARVAIDDFGTGYSSLSHLRVLPVDELKIDRSFVMNMVQDENDAVIVHSTIDLAHNLGLTVTAEGVEEKEALSLLMTLTCDMAQGFFMGRPMPTRQFQQWLRESPWGLGGG